MKDMKTFIKPKPFMYNKLRSSGDHEVNNDHTKTSISKKSVY